MQHRCRGSQSLRYRLVLSHLANRPLRCVLFATPQHAHLRLTPPLGCSVDDIRVDDPAPGLRDHEACLLRLLEKVTNGTVVEINETGTRLRYAPGVVTGGAGLEHDCGSTRSLGYFLEPLVCLALFAKKARAAAQSSAAAAAGCLSAPFPSLADATPALLSR